MTPFRGDLLNGFLMSPDVSVQTIARRTVLQSAFWHFVTKDGAGILSSRLEPGALAPLWLGGMRLPSPLSHSSLRASPSEEPPVRWTSRREKVDRELLQL